MFKETVHLIKKDILLELRQKFAINAILLYVVATVLIISMVFENTLTGETWNALLWIIMMFSAINAVSKTFMQENSNRQVYYFSLASPRAQIFSKIFYNTILLVIIATLVFAGFYFFLPSPVIAKPVYFFLNLLLGAVGYASVLTLISAIASRTNNNFTLMAVLSFPLLLPLLLINIKISALSTIAFNEAGENLQLLIFQSALIYIVVMILAAVLYPYIWRE